MVLLVKMPSRVDTLQWLGDDVKALPSKVSDILKHDLSVAASPAVRATGPKTTNGKVDPEESPQPDVGFSDSFSPPGLRRAGLPLDSDVERPTVDVDTVTDAVSSLTVVSSTAADSNGDISGSSAAVDLAAAAVPTTDDAVIGAVGGTDKKNSLLSVLAQFADETVR